MALGCSGHGPYSLPSVVFALDLLWDAFPLTDQNPQFFNIFLTVEGFAFLSPLLSFCRCTKIMIFIVTFSFLLVFWDGLLAALSSRLSLNLCQSPCLSLFSCGILGMSHQMKFFVVIELQLKQFKLFQKLVIFFRFCYLFLVLCHLDRIWSCYSLIDFCTKMYICMYNKMNNICELNICVTYTCH